MPSQPQHRLGVTQLAWTAAIVGWLAAAAVVMWWVTSYEFSTYEVGAPATVARWPADAGLRLSAERPTLLFFMHPKCPCTRASLTEFQKLLEGSTLTDDQLPDVTVVVSQPADADPAWLDTDTVRRATALPHATLYPDADGVESDRFGVNTSGTVVLFDRAGTRRFAGGVTASRGHEGDSAGGVALRRLLQQEEATAIAPVTPTFGCKLCTAGETSASCQATEEGP